MYTHPPGCTLFGSPLALYMMHHVFFTRSLNFGRHNIFQACRVFYSSSSPCPTPIFRKNRVVTAYNTDNQLACEFIVLQRAIFDEMISKQTLDIDQIVQIKYLNASTKVRKIATASKKCRKNIKYSINAFCIPGFAQKQLLKEH